MKNKKRLVITGSEGLIGQKLVEHFKDDYEVIPLDIRLGHDLSNEKFVADWFTKNKDLYGMIVCHAYNSVPAKDAKKVEPVDIPLKELRDYLEVNVVSVFDVCRNFIRNNKNGVIVNVGSIYGAVSPKHHLYKNFTKHIGYPISKAAVAMLSKYLATYYATNIRVNTVMFGGISDPKQDPNFVKEYNANVPFKRLMRPDEAVSVFEFLLDERSSYVTGAEFFVDGGWTAW
ncbi:MAG TPA: SDR family oxidoreductase [Candidatus Paceibacterota bacterium]